jgi:hypothetical protein
VGEVVGVIGAGDVGVLAGANGLWLDADAPVLGVTPPQFPSTITSRAMKTQPSRRMAAANILHPKKIRDLLSSEDGATL